MTMGYLVSSYYS